jgi:hypothetical protein
MNDLERLMADFCGEKWQGSIYSGDSPFPASPADTSPSRLRGLPRRRSSRRWPVMASIPRQKRSLRTAFATLNRTLKRLHAHKEELLLVLKRPDIVLHTNGSGGDIGGYVKWRKISGGTRSELGKRCRDGFASLKKTAASESGRRGDCRQDDARPGQSHAHARRADRNTRIRRLLITSARVTGRTQSEHRSAGRAVGAA